MFKTISLSNEKVDIKTNEKISIFSLPNDCDLYIWTDNFFYYFVDENNEKHNISKNLASCLPDKNLEKIPVKIEPKELFLNYEIAKDNNSIKIKRINKILKIIEEISPKIRLKTVHSKISIPRKNYEKTSQVNLGNLSESDYFQNRFCEFQIDSTSEDCLKNYIISFIKQYLMQVKRYDNHNMDIPLTFENTETKIRLTISTDFEICVHERINETDFKHYIGNTIIITENRHNKNIWDMQFDGKIEISENEWKWKREMYDLIDKNMREKRRLRKNENSAIDI